MTFVVPFDGSDLAKTALAYATRSRDSFDHPVLALAVVPDGNVGYAREHGWLGDDERFDADAISRTLHDAVCELAPDATCRLEWVDKYAPAGAIARRIRSVAEAVDADVVFVGSENAGHRIVGRNSVGGSIALDDTFDLVIVRNAAPAKLAADSGPEHGDVSG